jgi:hypothetical protein
MDLVGTRSPDPYERDRRDEGTERLADCIAGEIATTHEAADAEPEGDGWIEMGAAAATDR